MVEILMEAGYDINWQQVEQYAVGGTGVYKQHIMHALLDAGYTDQIYGDLYKKLFARGNENTPPGIAYIPMMYVDAVTAVRSVVAAGGVPVLAHPGQYGNFPIVGDLAVAGLAGIEVWHPSHNEELENTARKLAETYGLIMTGGTDFHGFYGETEISLGSKNPGVIAVEQLMIHKRKGNQHAAR
jgi:predicted metal-dependent phosphoesterase TrpH